MASRVANTIAAHQKPALGHAPTRDAGRHDAGRPSRAIIAAVEEFEQGLVVREKGVLEQRHASESPRFEALRTDFRRRLPAVRAFGLVALIAGGCLFAAAMVSFLAGGATGTLIIRTAGFAAYAAGAFYVAIALLGDADAIDRALLSGYSLEFETMFLEKRRGWQRIAAVGGVAVGIALTSILLAGGFSFARSLTRARQEATTRARMEKIAAAAELFAIRHREYPATAAPERDAWGGSVVYATRSVNGRRVSFQIRSAGRDRRWNTGDDVTMLARVVLK